MRGEGGSQLHLKTVNTAIYIHILPITIFVPRINKITIFMYIKNISAVVKNNYTYLRLKIKVQHKHVSSILNLKIISNLEKL